MEQGFAFQNGRKHTQLLSEKQILLRALVTRDEVKMTFGLVKITTPWGKFTPIAVFSLQKCFLQGKNYHALRKIYPYGCIFSELGVHFPQGVVIFTRPKVVFTWSPVASVRSKNCFSRSKNCFSESSWVCFLPSPTSYPIFFYSVVYGYLHCSVLIVARSDPVNWQLCGSCRLRNRISAWATL